jgi:hypothetical protein
MKAQIVVNDLQRACVALNRFLDEHEITDTGILYSIEYWCYVAPEVMISDSDTSFMSDVWTFGCICYEVGQTIAYLPPY